MSEEEKQFKDTSGLVKRLSERAFVGLPPLVANIFISVIMLVGEQYYVEFNFRCPCVNASACGSGTNGQLLGRMVGSLRTDRKSVTSSYSITTIALTTIVIFSLTFLANATMKWKCERRKCKNGLQFGDCCYWFIQSTCLALVWFVILLMDGDYLACARTCNAYGDTPCSDVEKMVGELPFSESYEKSKEFSHSMGLILGCCLVVAYGLLKLARENDGASYNKGFFCCFNKCCCEYDEALRPPNARKIEKELEEYILRLKEKLPSQAQKLLSKVENIQDQPPQSQNQGVLGLQVQSSESQV